MKTTLPGKSEYNLNFNESFFWSFLQSDGCQAMPISTGYLGQPWQRRGAHHCRHGDDEDSVPQSLERSSLRLTTSFTSAAFQTPPHNQGLWVHIPLLRHSFVHFLSREVPLLRKRPPLCRSQGRLCPRIPVRTPGLRKRKKSGCSINPPAFASFHSAARLPTCSARYQRPVIRVLRTFSSRWTAN